GSARAWPPAGGPAFASSAPSRRSDRSTRPHCPAPAFKTSGSATSQAAQMTGPTKIAVAIRADLANWQQLNVTAFLVSGIAATRPDTTGEPYQDASGTHYLPMFGQPVLVYTADAEALAKARERAVQRSLAVAVYTEELFATGND